MFRNNPIGSILVSVFFLLALSACWLSVRYFFSVKELDALGYRYQANEAKRKAADLLVAETVEYSKRRPDIDPLLQQLRIKAPPAATSAPPPTARPAR